MGGGVAENAREELGLEVRAAGGRERARFEH